MPSTDLESPETFQKDVPKEKLDEILRHHVWGAMGVGLIPIPWVDLVGLTGVQINLVRRLAKVYGIPFSQNTAKSIVGALLSSVAPKAMALPVALSIAKIVPFLGQTAGVVTMPILAGAATYALGRVFIQHFATGGTFLTFDPEQAKEYYMEMFQEGKKVATEIKAEKTAKHEETIEEGKSGEPVAEGEAAKPEKGETETDRKPAKPAKPEEPETPDTSEEKAESKPPKKRVSGKKNKDAE